MTKFTETVEEYQNINFYKEMHQKDINKGHFVATKMYIMEVVLGAKLLKKLFK